MKKNSQLVLGSTSVYRQRLLKKLGIHFVCIKPPLDEEKHKDTSLHPLPLAEKLAFLKAESVFEKLTVEADANSKSQDQKRSDQLWTVIGSDQLVSFQGQILGKPGTVQKALEQLSRMSHQTHQLITAVTIIHGTKDNLQVLNFHDITQIKFKKLKPEQIQKYIQIDQPLDCAGGYKFESYGMGLIEELKTQDPSAIEGLPLIQLSNLLQELGYEIFSEF